MRSRARLKNQLPLLALSASAFVGILAQAPVAEAAPRVVLLTSMAMPKNVELLNRSYFAMAPFRLEKTFRKFFDEIPGFELQVIHGADAYQTWATLGSPDNAAVFWVSHAGNFGLFGGDVLTDVSGRNIAPVFQGIHPNNRILALVGCTTNPILRRMAEDGTFRANAGMQLLGTDTIVEARPALKDALERARPRLLQLRQRDAAKGGACPSRRGLPLMITRTVDPSLPRGTRTPPVQVEAGGKLVSVLPASEPGRTDTTRVWIEAPATKELRASQLKLVFKTGAGTEGADPRSLGSYAIQAPWTGARWELFTQQGSREAMGVTRNIYRYKGALELDSEPSAFAPTRCL